MKKAQQQNIRPITQPYLRRNNSAVSLKSSTAKDDDSTTQNTTSLIDDKLSEFRTELRSDVKQMLDNHAVLINSTLTNSIDSFVYTTNENIQDLKQKNRDLVNIIVQLRREQMEDFDRHSKLVAEYQKLIAEYQNIIATLTLKILETPDIKHALSITDQDSDDRDMLDSTNSNTNKYILTRLKPINPLKQPTNTIINRDDISTNPVKYGIIDSSLDEYLKD